MADNNKTFTHRDNLKLQRNPGYFQRWFYYLGTAPDITHRKAWEMVERDFKESFGRHRFSSYPVFKTMKSRYFKDQ